MPTMLQGLAEIGRIRSVRYGLSDGIFGLSSYVGSKNEQQKIEMKRRLEHFVTFVRYFETMTSYEKAKSEANSSKMSMLESKLVERADVYAGLASIFNSEERQTYQTKLTEVKDVITIILEGKTPSPSEVEESLTTLKTMRQIVIERTSDQEKTAERMIYGSIPAL